MNLIRDLLHRINDPILSPDVRAHLRCQLAKQLEQAWNFEAAREAMGELWQRVGDLPDVQGLNEQAKAEVFLRAGALTGWIGSTRQIDRAQETAKNLITESIAIFESLKLSEKVSEAEIELAYCYWRQGAFDNARAMLQKALATPFQLSDEVRALGVLRSAIVEESTNRFHDALSILKEGASLFDTLDDVALKGKFHNECGFVLSNLFGAEQRKEYLDQALIEFSAAGFYFEQAKLSRQQACVENNLGFLYGTLRSFGEAHEHLDRAQAIFTRLGDSVHLAQVDETRSQLMIEEGQFTQAEKLVRKAVETLETGGEQSLLAEALITQGIALARLHNYQLAHSVLRRAAEVAEEAGDLEGAGRAHLTLLEELGQHLTNDELCASVERAKHLLANTQDLGMTRRLANCACEALLLVSAVPMHPDWTRFSWKHVMRRFEAHFIRLALRDAGGSITEAARLLGITHHQSLSAVLHTRHKNLLNARSMIVPRKRRLIGESDSDQGAVGPERPAQAIVILHVDNDEMVAATVKELLGVNGWQVDSCADGNKALDKILGDTHYDLLLLAYDLPGMNGIELVHRARKLAHRATTPIIVLSSTPVDAATFKAGADEFLRKPEGVSFLVEAITRLIGEFELDGGLELNKGGRSVRERRFI